MLPAEQKPRRTMRKLRHGSALRMTFNPAWVCLALVILLLAIAGLPLFRFLDSAPGSGARHVAIDGLRGFLALSVFFSHIAVTHHFIGSGVWEPPASRFYSLLGPVGVSVFFMITGFLFWGRLLRTRGRPGWRALYAGRLFRIAPLYLAMVLAMFAIVFMRTGLQLHEPLGNVLISMLQWLALGAINTQPAINGYAQTDVLGGVTWTLAYEWAFYASLLATAWFARGRFHLLWVLGALAVLLTVKAWLHIDAAGFAVLFLCGMACASLLHADWRLRLSARTASTLACLCLAILFGTQQHGYGTVSAFLLSVFFYLVCSGATLFGLLARPSAQRLGHISYSLYLLHGLVLSLVFAIPAVRGFALTSPARFWAIGGLCACLLLLIAALAYALIERPGIALGKRFAMRHEPLLDDERSRGKRSKPGIEDADGAGRGTRGYGYPQLGVGDHLNLRIVRRADPGRVRPGEPAAGEGDHCADPAGAG
jgi:peptidoglycan/LPS O-acetylase OafA/YrhL